jgi:hypothetical protein
MVVHHLSISVSESIRVDEMLMEEKGSGCAGLGADGIAMTLGLED